MSVKRRPVATQVATGDGLEFYKSMFAVSADDAGTTLPAGLPALTLGWQILEWIAANVRNPETGEPWELTREQVRHLCWWYAYDESGRPLYTRSEIVRMKGAGKSPYGALLALVEVCGPCRPGPDGTAIPAMSPLIQVAGVAEDSTESVLDFTRRLAKASTLPIDVGLGRMVTATGGIIEGITASPWTAEGARPSLVIAEETQHWQQQNRGRRLYQVLARNTAKNPSGWARVLSLTNRHEPGLESIAETMWEAHVAGLPGVLYDLREGPANVDFSDRADVLRALAVAAGDAHWVPLERIADEVALTQESIARRFYFNTLTHASESWLDASEFDRCVIDREITTTEPLAMAFDGSIGRTSGNATADATVIVGCTLTGHLFPIACWSQPPGVKDWTVPVEHVIDVVRTWMATHNVVAFAADPAHWEGVVAGWESEYGDQLAVKAGATSIAYRMNRPGVVGRDTEALHSAIIGGAVTVEGTPLFRSHFLNARRRPGTYGTQLRKETSASDRKIDLAVASVLAYALALEARRAGADKPKPTSFKPYRIR